MPHNGTCVYAVQVEMLITVKILNSLNFFMISVINLLKEQKSEYEMRITHILERITPKGDFLCMCNPNDIPRLQNLLKEYELFVADLEKAIKILNCV